jgi:hypothetical protein
MQTHKSKYRRQASTQTHRHASTTLREYSLAVDALALSYSDAYLCSCQVFWVKPKCKTDFDIDVTLLGFPPWDLFLSPMNNNNKNTAPRS